MARLIFQKKKVNTIKSRFLVAFSALGTFIAQLFGGFTYDLQTLVILMAADFLSGLAVAGIFKKSKKSSSGALESKAGFKGISKKCLTLGFVLIAHRLDLSVGTEFFRTAVIFAYTANELISITENATLMGVPVPQAIKKAIDILNSQADEKGDDK